MACFGQEKTDSWMCRLVSLLLLNRNRRVSSYSQAYLHDRQTGGAAFSRCSRHVAKPCLVLSLLPLRNEETTERVQSCSATACSRVIVRPWAHALAKVSLPSWARAFATTRS